MPKQSTATDGRDRGRFSAKQTLWIGMLGLRTLVEEEPDWVATYT